VNRWLAAAMALGLIGLLAPAGRGADRLPPTREEAVALVEDGPGHRLGRADAPVTIVEFSDFQCIYCRRFWQETLPRVRQRYIDAGKARYVYRHLAILGEPSVAAGNAAECAGEQGKFWPFHDLLFERQARLAFAEARLKAYAAELGLDAKAFGGCVESGRHRERVRRETTIGRMFGMTGTPAFLVNGRLLIGAYPFEEFAKAIEQALAEGGRSRPGAPAR
jgi:protein-disulfide isomerase